MVGELRGLTRRLGSEGLSSKDNGFEQSQQFESIPWP